jgi:hypothetical protein
MAKVKATLGNNTKKPTKRIRRKGIVAKSKAARNPNSKNYLKRYRGQGR